MEERERVEREWNLSNDLLEILLLPLSSRGSSIAITKMSMMSSNYIAMLTNHD